MRLFPINDKKTKETKIQIIKKLNLDQFISMVSKYCYQLRFPEKSTFNFNFLKLFQSEHHGFLRIQEIKLIAK